jgi:hypothetical protein
MPLALFGNIDSETDKMDNQKIIMAGIIGGTVAGALNSIPVLNFINCFCCLGIMLGGAVALFYYDRSFLMKDYINPALAVTLGITSGLFGAFSSLFFDWIIYLNFGHWELELMQSIMDNMDQVPPVLDEIFYELEDELKDGFIWGSILLRNLLLMPVFCLIGSLITRVLLNKNREQN